MSNDRFECEKVGLEVFDDMDKCIVSKVTLPCTPEALFACFEDAEAWTVWVDAIKQVEWTSPKPFGIGTTRAVTLPGGMIGYEEFLAWEPGKRMAFRFSQCSKKNVAVFAEDYQVTDLDDGRCHLVWSVAMEQRGVQKVIAPLIKPLLRRYFQKTLNGLGNYMDTEGRKFSQAAPA